MPGDLVLAEVEDTQLPVTGNVNFLPTESAGQLLLFGLTGCAESPSLILPGIEMSPPGDTPISGGTRDHEFTSVRVMALRPKADGELADRSNGTVVLAVFDAESATGPRGRD